MTSKMQPPKNHLDTNLDSTTNLKKPKEERFSISRLEIDFLIDSGAESKIINLATGNESQTLHPE